MILPWHWRSLPLNHLTGSEVFERLFYQRGAIATLLESPYPTPRDSLRLSRYSICAGSPRLIAGKPQLWTPPVGKILPLLRHLQKQVGFNPTPLEENLPFIGGWLGWLGYDLAWEIEKLPHINHDPLPFPVAYWYEPDSFAILDHSQQILFIASTDFKTLDHLQHRLETNTSVSAELVLHPNLCSASQSYFSSLLTGQTKPLTFCSDQAAYEEAVRQALKYIQAGDIFQANLSLRFETTTTASSWTIYRQLQHINPSPFASYWQTPWGAIISCSPERLIQLTANKAQTRPIAGTRSRGVTSELDQRLVKELLGNIKERAEHIMLVDLERNDLGRVCQWGSVEVDELLTIERYSHVMHLVSNVRGILKPEYDSVDLIEALFPGGTITGCPKVRCMEIIEELEPLSRNLFYGSCGYLDLRGNLDLNILIRTLLYTPLNQRQTAPVAKVWGQVGAGIVADSDPEKEWYESLNKAQAQLDALKIVGAQGLRPK